ncbi:hypothetical protein KKG71_03105 [Patescibacteria group bacterium]|nr:hypothetical protein [Patescibacteria group bacterium]
MLPKNNHQLIYRIQPQTHLTCQKHVFFDFDKAPSSNSEYLNQRAEQKYPEWLKYTSRAINAYHGRENIKNIEDLKTKLKKPIFLKKFISYKRKYLKNTLKLTDYEIRHKGLLKFETDLLADEEKKTATASEMKKIDQAKKNRKKMEETVHFLIRIQRLLLSKTKDEELPEDIKTMLNKTNTGKKVSKAYNKVKKLQKLADNYRKQVTNYSNIGETNKKHKAQSKLETIEKEITNQEIIINNYVKDKLNNEIKTKDKKLEKTIDYIETSPGTKNGRITNLKKEYTAKINELKKLYEKLDKLEKKTTKSTNDTTQIKTLKNKIASTKETKDRLKYKIEGHKNTINKFKYCIFKHLTVKTYIQTGAKREIRKNIGDTAEQTFARIYDNTKEHLDNMDTSQKFWAAAGIVAILVYVKRAKSEEAKALANFLRTAGLGVFGYYVMNKGLLPLTTGKNISENLENWRSKIVGDTILAQALRNEREKPENFQKRMVIFRKGLDAFRETKIPARKIIETYYAAKDNKYEKTQEMYIAGITPNRMSKKELFLTCKYFFDKYPARKIGTLRYDPPIISNYYNNLSFIDHIAGTFARDRRIKINRDPLIKLILFGKRGFKTATEIAKESVKDIITSQFGLQTYESGKSLFTFFSNLTSAALWTTGKAGDLMTYVGNMIKKGKTQTGSQLKKIKFYRSFIKRMKELQEYKKYTPENQKVFIKLVKEFLKKKRRINLDPKKTPLAPLANPKSKHK